jgi:hypothetical protein
MAKVYPLPNFDQIEKPIEFLCPYQCVVINSSPRIANHRLTGKEICCTYICYISILFCLLIIPLIIE